MPTPGPESDIERMINFDEIADQLCASPDHKVLNRIDRLTQFLPDDDKPKRKGLLVDVETTGLDTKQDVIIELGCILFEYGIDGTIYRILDEYNGLEDPQQPLAPEIVKLTGLTDDDVKGQSLDTEAIENLFNQADIVIAHNASFDRPMLERRFAEFAQKPWGCSINSVNWQDEGVSSAKLDYILFKLGKFHEGHRAVEDCHATLFVLRSELPVSHSLAMGQILEKARHPDLRIFANNAAYEVKDELKARGYKWSDGADGKAKSWYLDVTPENLEPELKYLADQKIQGHFIPVLELTPMDLYTDRALVLPPRNQWRAIGNS